ncbi:MAG: hypothetical protein H6719_33000 [Sandaracinaceae bacterium]|nr:hypothetical protein [Sandaracinaceae bacterium]
MRRAILAGLALALTTASVASAQAPTDPARLFPREAPIELPATTGLVRLALPAAVLEGSRPDLSDVRIHDERGAARPYLVESATRRGGDATIYAITPTEVSRRIERRSSLASVYREHLVLTPPPQVPEGRWTLWLDSAQASFVRDVVVFEVRDDRREQIAEATVFRMQAPLRDRLGVELPRIAEGARLEVQVSGEGGYLEPNASLIVLTVPVEPPTVALPLTEVARTRRDGRTILELARPAGLVPDRVLVTTGAANFFREVRVLDLSAGAAPREVGHGSLFRVHEIDGAEWVAIDVERAVGDRLRVEIDDGDSPELEGLAFEAIVRQPTLLFESDGAPVTLRFGGGRAQAPRYDIQRLVGTRLGDRLLGAALPEATLGEPVANPRFDDGPALRFAMRPGRTPEVAGYTDVATLLVEGATEGLSRVRLPASVLAAARDDLADVRVVDGDGAQWPYLRGADASDPIALAVEVDDGASSSETLHRLTPPVEGRLERLELHTDAPFVSRAFRLYGVDAAGERSLLASGRLTREPNDPRPLEVTWAPRRVTRLELVVEDGSDAPLEFGEARGWIPSPTLYLAAPDGSYSVLVGDLEAEPPRYEIESARELVLSVRAVDATVGEATPNPAHAPPPEPSWWEEQGLSSWIVWAVLLFAILVLGLLTWRIARQPADGEAPPPPEGPEPPSASGPPVRF